MTDVPPSTGGAPWLRLTGGVLIGLAIVDVAVHRAFPWFLGQMRDPDRSRTGFAESELDDALRTLVNDASIGVDLIGAFAMATLLLLFLLRARGMVRIPAALAGAAALFATAPLVSLMIYTDKEIIRGRIAAWLDYGSVARLVVAVALVAVVYLHAPRGRGVRGVSIAAVVVGLAATACFSSLRLPDAQRWWMPWLKEMLGPFPLYLWIVLLDGLGKGLGLWLAAAPSEDQRTEFEAAAARGLRLARTTMWLRVVGAVAAVSTLIAGSISLQKSAAATRFSRASIDLPVAFEVAPWLCDLAFALDALLVVALAAAVLQRRSTLTTVLVATGGVLLSTAAVGSFALNAALHRAVREIVAHGFGWGDDLQRFTDLSELLDPILRGAAILGTASVLFGLARLAGKTGHPTSHRLTRFFAACGILTVIWLYRDPIDDLGNAASLMLLIVLIVTAWGLWNLTMYVGDVADGLDGKRPGSLPVLGAPGPAGSERLPDSGNA